MTIAKEVQCDACSGIYHLKLLADETIKILEWPIVVECAICGNTMSFTFDKDGNFRKRDNGKWITVDERKAKDLYSKRGYIMCYSPTLPIVPSLFHVEVPSGMGPYSPFIMFPIETGLEWEDIKKCNMKNTCIIQNIIPYKNALWELFNILSHRPLKIDAFARKVAKVFDLDADAKATLDENSCFDFYDELQQTIFQNLIFQGHPNTIEYDFYHEACCFINSRKSDGMQDMINALKGLLDIDRELFNSYNHIANIVSVLDKLLQGVFASEIKRLQLDVKCPLLHIVTISHGELLQLYAKGYEIICKFLPLLAGINNSMKRTGFDDFGDGSGYKVFRMYSMPNGRMIELLSEVDPFSKILSDILNAHWRNANEHIDIDYRPDTQICSFKYDASRPGCTEDVALIEVAKAVYRQVVFLIEISNLVLLIKKKR